MATSSLSASALKRKSMQSSMIDFLPSLKRQRVTGESCPVQPTSDEASKTQQESERDSPPLEKLQRVPEKETVKLPDCWNTKQWYYFQEEYKWLYLKSGNIGCSSCKRAKSTGLSVHNNTQGMRVSKVWADGEVGPSGDGKAFRQKQLRKKIMEHKASAGHLAAEDILTAQQKNTLVVAVHECNAKHMESTCRVFDTAYYLAKKDRPFTDHPDLILLQAKNGSAMGRVLHSNVTATEIIKHIALEMQQRLVCYIRQHKPKITVLIDESTSISNASTLIIYLRGIFGNESTPVTIYFGLLELAETNAIGVKTALLSYFEKVGLTKSLLHDILIAVCTDGAAVMFGKKGGVVALLKSEFPNLVLTWHCLAHRLELAVADTVDEVAGVNHFKIFMDSLYATYSMSPKNQRELNLAASELCVQLQKIGKMLDTRWVASSYRSVKAVWNCFPALCKHFENASKDPSRPIRDRSKYEGLLKKLTSYSFIRDLGVMCDALQELKDLSLSLQKRDITIVNAHRLLVSQVRIFIAMKDSPGEFASAAQRAVDEGKFKNVPLSHGRSNSVALNQNQFYQSLSVNINKRCAPDSEKELIASFSVLDASNLPSGDECILYGETDIQKLCSEFQLPARDTIQAFRLFKDFGGKKTPEALKKLVVCMETLPASNADCERGFSAMNLIACPTRASLLVETISSCLWVKLNGPPFETFDAKLYVKSWLAKGRRSAEENCCEKPQQNNHTEYLQGFWGILQ
ncbi:E3 SUMO-protein ligase KIAA1586-like [Lissotriton helveticus]